MLLLMGVFSMFLAIFATVYLTIGDKVFWFLLSILSISALPIVLAVFRLPQNFIDISMIIGPWLILVVRVIKIDGVKVEINEQ